MSYLFKDSDGIEWESEFKPKRVKDKWSLLEYFEITKGWYMNLDEGTIKKRIGKELTFQDEPVKIVVKED